MIKPYTNISLNQGQEQQYNTVYLPDVFFYKYKPSIKFPALPQGRTLLTVHGEV